MLQLTNEANEYLRQIRNAKGIDSKAGARFVRSSGGIGFTFASAPAPGDQVLTESDLAVYIPDDLAAPLALSIVDVSREGGTPRLVLRPQ